MDDEGQTTEQFIAALIAFIGYLEHEIAMRDLRLQHAAEREVRDESERSALYERLVAVELRLRQASASVDDAPSRKRQSPSNHLN